MTYQVILKSLKAEDERIVLSACPTAQFAETRRKEWRHVLGGNRYWTVDRRPGLDTLDHLALVVEKVT